MIPIDRHEHGDSDAKVIPSYGRILRHEPVEWVERMPDALAALTAFLRTQFVDLYARGLYLVTRIKKNMTNKSVTLLGKLLVRKRAIIESAIDPLKNVAPFDKLRAGRSSTLATGAWPTTSPTSWAGWSPTTRPARR